jgi:flagellar motor protein MotB
MLHRCFPFIAALITIMLTCGAGTGSVHAQSMPSLDGHCIPGTEQPTLEAIVDESDYVRSLAYSSYPARYRDFRGLLIEEHLVKELYPVLTSVFFDAGKSELPGRYTIFRSPDQTEGFDETRLPGGVIQKYHQILNIIGSRLRNHPDAKISIGGYDSQQPWNNETRETAEARATTILNYFLNIWGIDPSRMKIIPSGGYPRHRSDIQNPITAAENRRVEIISDHWEIVKPIVSIELRRSIDPGEMKFRMRNGIPDSLISRREIEITRHGKPWHSLAKIGPGDSLSPKFNWGKGGVADSIPAEEAPYLAQLIISLKDGRLCRSQPIEISMMVVTDERKWREKLIDETREHYTLLLFGFDAAELGALGDRILKEYIGGDIRKGARIEVIGHASFEPRPERLSAARAKAVEAAIRKVVKPGVFKSLVSAGIGEKAPLYNVDLPEARFYNRTVQVMIVTPAYGEE